MNTPITKKGKRGMVFGVFDHFHKGHEYFLTEAARQCDELIVVVTLPEIVEKLKGRTPRHSLEKRTAHVTEFNPQFVVVAGDATLGEWNVLRGYSPDIVFLGYDQQGIEKELKSLGVPCLFIDSHHPEQYKSSLMGGQTV